MKLIGVVEHPSSSHGKLCGGRWALPTPGGEIISQGTVAVIGGGVAGMRAALDLAQLDHEVHLFEKRDRLGGKVAGLSCLFPDMSSARDLVSMMIGQVKETSGLTVHLGQEVTALSRADQRFAVITPDEQLMADAVVMATGLEPVDPSILPEYGYGRLENVVTSLELEGLWSTGRLHRPSDHKEPGSVVFVQCVGSRSERRGVPYCGATCCAVSLKGAIEIKRSSPGTEVYVLYIDIRAPGKGQEALYREARRLGTRFIRGQPAMVIDRNGLMVCGENTLIRQLYEIPADLVVLCVGQRQAPSSLLLLDSLGVHQTTVGFPEVRGARTSVPGVFVVGSAEAPKDARTAMDQADAGAMQVHLYLRAQAGPGAPRGRW